MYVVNTQTLVKNTTKVVEGIRKFLLLPTNPAFERVTLPHDDHTKVIIVLLCMVLCYAVCSLCMPHCLLSYCVCSVCLSPSRTTITPR
jgi:hypothetical protein